MGLISKLANSTPAKLFGFGTAVVSYGTLSPPAYAAELEDRCINTNINPFLGRQNVNLNVAPDGRVNLTGNSGYRMIDGTSYFISGFDYGILRNKLRDQKAKTTGQPNVDITDPEIGAIIQKSLPKLRTTVNGKGNWVQGGEIKPDMVPRINY